MKIPKVAAAAVFGMGLSFTFQADSQTNSYQVIGAEYLASIQIQCLCGALVICQARKALPPGAANLQSVIIYLWLKRCESEQDAIRNAS